MALRRRKTLEMTPQKDIEALRRARVRQLFQALPSEARTEDGIMKFYGWLQLKHPELLPRTRNGDPYQFVMAELSGLYK
jgi:hypothetical protein